MFETILFLLDSFSVFICIVVKFVHAGPKFDATNNNNNKQPLIFLTRSRKDLLTRPEFNIVIRQKSLKSK